MGRFVVRPSARRLGAGASFVAALALVVPSVMFGMATAASAAPLSFVVNSPADASDANPGDGICATTAGVCTTRAAAAAPNPHAGPDIITIAAGINPTLSIAGINEDNNATGDLDVNGSMTVRGGSATIDAASIDRIFDVHAGDLTIQDLTLTNGTVNELAGHDGGEIQQGGGTGSVTVSDSTFTNGLIDNDGGAISAAGPITVTNSTFASNAGQFGQGGAISGSGSVAIIGSTFTNNESENGGAVAGADVTVRTSTINGNAVRAITDLVPRSALEGAGIFATHSLTLDHSTVSNNRTDGFNIIQEANAGGVVVTGAATITNSTLADNASATVPFGGPGANLVTTSGSVEGSTITGSQVGVASSSVQLGATLLDNQIDCQADAVTSVGFNLATDATCGLIGTADRSGVASGLGALADNEGPTQTQLPGTGSSAIDAIPFGTACLCDTSTSTDQRNLPRPSGHGCDIGAVEVQQQVADRFTPVTPARLLDTRASHQVGPYSTPFTSNSTRVVQIGGTAKVPADADAVTLNVTAVDTTANGFLTVYPTNQPRPVASNVNWAAQQIKPNAVTATLGPDGAVEVYTAGGSADVIIDVSGYYTAGGADAYTPLMPARILDSRAASQRGPFSTPWTSNVARNVTVAGVGGIPADADAVVVNVTTTDTTAAGFLTAYAAGQTRPPTSNLNWRSGETVANSVTVKVGDSGQVTIYVAGGSADVLIDVSGSFTAGSGGAYHPTVPHRVLDTRSASQIGPLTTFGPHTRQAVTITGNGVPTTATAVVTNVTVTNTTAASFLSIFQSGTSSSTSNLNWVAGQTLANAVPATLPTGGGAIQVFNAAGNVDVIIDVSGWYG